jgi:sulfur relay (sulfurtransferase) complex TusBCD TusD component (DsrE family)
VPPRKKLGLLLSTRPEAPGFQHGLKLAAAALDQGVEVYLYCLDEAVHGLAHPQLLALQQRGLKLFACAYAARRRHLPLTGAATFAGLTVLDELIHHTDRFISFN